MTPLSFLKDIYSIIQHKYLCWKINKLIKLRPNLNSILLDNSKLTRSRAIYCPSLKHKSPWEYQVNNDKYIRETFMIEADIQDWYIDFPIIKEELENRNIIIKAIIEDK